MGICAIDEGHWAASDASRGISKNVWKPQKATSPGWLTHVDIMPWLKTEVEG